MKCTFFVLVLWLFVGTCWSQNCKTRGEWCPDTDACCGGCCIRNQCIDTFSDCRELEDPCLTNYCPGNSICRIYQPKCEGCDREMQCVFSDESDEDRAFPTKKTIVSGAMHLKPIYYLICFVVSLFICTNYKLAHHN